MRALAAIVAAAALAGAARAATPAADAVRFLESRQAADGGFAEAGRTPDAPLTAWGALALAAGNASPAARASALAFLVAREPDARTDLDAALQALARLALGDRPEALLERVRAHRPGALVNATIWSVLALAAARQPIPPAFVRAIVGAQSRTGGWPWGRGGAPDSNDTAAALQALRAAGVSGRPIERGVRALRAFQHPGGGFALTRGRAPDAQSTAWAIQALLATGRRPGAGPYRFLAGLRRPDGGYRYSRAYATTPVWVTCQVVPALAGRPFPFVGPTWSASHQE